MEAVRALEKVSREDAVLMEVEASARLFEGKRALRDRVVQESRDLGVVSVAWAVNSLAAQAFARAGLENGFKRPLEELLDRLPLKVLSDVHAHGEVEGLGGLGDEELENEEENKTEPADGRAHVNVPA